MGYVYSAGTRHFSLKALCRILSMTYGSAISVLSLQSAILARFSSYLPGVQFSSVLERHKERAWRELIRKTKSPWELCDADFFAAFVLGTMAWDREEFEETLTHYRGCLAIWDHLVTNQSGPSDLLVTFGPYVLDTLSMCDKIACITSVNAWDTVIRRPTAFNDRIRYFEILQHRGEAGAISGSVEAVHDFLDDMVTLMITAVVEVAKKEMKGFTRDNKLSAVIRFIEAEMSLRQFGETLAQIRSTAGKKRSGHYVVAECLQNQLYLASAILHGRTILQSLHRRVVNSQAEDLLAHYRSKVKPVSSSVGPRGKYIVSGLMLAGIALSPVKWNSGILFSCNRLMAEREWLLNELRENPYSDGSEDALDLFWKERDNGTLIFALEKTSELARIIV
jgi:hypothetical protein